MLPKPSDQTPPQPAAMPSWKIPWLLGREAEVSEVVAEQCPGVGLILLRKSPRGGRSSTQSLAPSAPTQPALGAAGNPRNSWKPQEQLETPGTAGNPRNSWKQAPGTAGNPRNSWKIPAGSGVSCREQGVLGRAEHLQSLWHPGVGSRERKEPWGKEILGVSWQVSQRKPTRLGRGIWSRAGGRWSPGTAPSRVLTMRVAVLLLLGVVEARGPCFFNRTQEHCVCYNLSQKSIGSLIQCLAASVVEFWGGELERYTAQPITDLEDAPTVLGSLIIKKIVFGDLLVPEVLLAQVLRFFSYTHVEELVFKSCVFQGRGNWAGMAGQGLPILSLRFHNVTSAPLLGREEEFSSLGTWLETLQELAVTESHVTSLPCGIGRLFKALHSLDLAGNSLGDESLLPTFCQGAFPQLQVLSLQHNELTSYPGVCQSLKLLPELQHLDLSQNKLLADPSSSSSSSCQWPETLRIFNLSAVGLDEVLRPLPPHLEVLDLSRNHLRAVDISLSFLRKLFLSQNLLEAAPSLGNCPRLDTLHLENNSIAELPWEEVKLLGVLQEVALDGNPYSCSCSGAGGLQALAAMGHLGQGWPQDYRCHLPPGYQGWQVKDVPVSGLQCHSVAVIVPITVVLVLLGLAGALCLLRSRLGFLQPCCRV